MKRFFTPFCLITISFFFGSCESPRKVSPDLDYGILIESADVPFYNSGEKDSLSEMFVSDRIKSSDSLIFIYTKSVELKFSYNETIKLFVQQKVNIGNETIYKVTDKYKIINLKNLVKAERTSTELELSDEKIKTIFWR
jgi:hypothetical protein